jgi:hypothetical protein
LLVRCGVTARLWSCVNLGLEGTCRLGLKGYGLIRGVVGRCSSPETSPPCCVLSFLLLTGRSPSKLCKVVLKAYPLSSCPPASPFRRFASAAGQFVLLAGLRAQVAPSLTSPSAPGQPKSGQMAASSVGEEFPQVTQERYAAISHRIVEDTTGRTRDADVDGALVLLVWAERLRTFVSRV